MQVGDEVRISPELTGLEQWIDAVIIEVEENHFNGIVISAKSTDGVIYFGQEKYFKKYSDVCTQ